MHRRISTLLSSAVCVAVLFFAGAPAAADAPRTIPECELLPMGSAPAGELLRARGQVLWVEFWASWCGSCAESFPFLDRLERELGGQGLRVLGINVDEEPDDARAFLARHAVGFAQAADPSGHCPRRFGVEAMPAGYLVDREGVVRYVHRGFRSRDAAPLRERVEALLAEKAAPTMAAGVAAGPRP
jgi:thiol-disulfide isomerase/thioredoxin